MPFGNGIVGAKGTQMQIQNNNLAMQFTSNFILPEEQTNVIRTVYRRNITNNPGLTPAQRQQKLNNINNMVTNIVNKLQACNGQIYPAYAESEGGHSLKVGSTKLNTYYLVMLINDVLVFEPIGQENNATFLAEKNEDFPHLIHDLQVKGRLGNVHSKNLFRIFHRQTNNKEYDFSSSHLFDIMDYADKDRNNFISALRAIFQTQEYCYLDKVSQIMPQTVNNILAGVAGQVHGRGITAQQVTQAANNIQQNGITQVQNAGNNGRNTGIIR